MFVSYTSAAIAFLLAIPVALLSLEVIAAVILPSREPPVLDKIARPRVAVLVPAHNESVSILPTLTDIKAQLASGDRLLVIADNCVDDTASIAAVAGAETIERNEPERHGKGFALDFGVRHLTQDPPAVVIVIDADCRVEDGAINHLAKICVTENRPAQALDLMTAPPESPINYRVAEFAWRVKNWTRPLGLKALNLPCQLMGTGMAFPWEIIRAANLASRSTVEDLRLGLDLARSGSPAIFCPSARVTSQFPLSLDGGRRQRARWEEGHIGMIVKTFPRFIYEATLHRDLGLFVLALDMAIPPLSLLVILVTTMSAIAGMEALFGYSDVAFTISAACWTALVSIIFLAWLKFGSDVVSIGAIASVFSYVFAKLPIYGRILSRSSSPEWTRTDRK